MRSISLVVPAISCAHCKQAVESTLKGFEGVQEAIVDIDNKRVALMASGGLSHQIVDEEFDHTVIDALEERNFDTLCSLPRDRLNRAPGTAESLNWVTIAGAMDPLPMTLIDYVPCYRSPAGTGIGATFGYWQ